LQLIRNAIILYGAIGERAGKYMNAKISYTDETIEARVIQDFLPPPEKLAFREEGVKVTIALSKRSVEFFKSEAARHHTQYQLMIRNLIDAYVDAYDKPLPSRSNRGSSKQAS
jgi:predicted DNA binding CopG/RHH family protein